MHFRLEPCEVVERAKVIRLLALDVDGVLTGGELHYTHDGHEIKTFNSLDGQGIKLLQQSGIQVAIISGRQSPMLTRRAEELGISLIRQGREDKRVALDELLDECNVELAHIAYAGDDLPDIQVMKAVGLGLTVSNGHESVRHIAHACTEQPGGQGAVREIADFLLQTQEKYESAIARFL